MRLYNKEDQMKFWGEYYIIKQSKRVFDERYKMLVEIKKLVNKLVSRQRKDS